MNKKSLQIVRKAADPPISTSSLSGGGLLPPYEAMQFIRQTFDVAPLTSQVRHEMHREKTGYLNKIAIGSRLLREKIEDTDDGYRAGITTSQIKYATVAMRLPWEMTEETLRENIEGQSLAELVTDMMTKQLGLDLEDLYLNGDEATIASHPDFDFLKLNDGWVKQITDNGHVTDAATVGAKNVIDLFDMAIDEIPDKYLRSVNFRWIMSPKTFRNWKRFLRDQVIEKGGIVDADLYNNPCGIPVIETPYMPGDAVLLADPKNLIVVNTYSVKVREDRSSKEAIMKDKRFYVTHLDADNIVQEFDATGIITGLDFRALWPDVTAPVAGEDDDEKKAG